MKSLNVILILTAFAVFLSLNFVAGQTATCQDSDGGLSYYILGRTIIPGTDTLPNGQVVTTTNFKDDVCNGDSLTEYSCSGSQRIETIFSCSNDCADGACIKDECDFIGTVNYNYGTNGEFCDADGTWKTLKANEQSCLNDYECDIGTCSEGICGGRYEVIAERGNLIQQIWNFLSGTECIPGEDDCRADDFLIRTCGATGLWEEKNAFVIGRCGYNPSGDECTINSCSGNVFLECVEGVLVNRGNVNGECGYNSGGSGPSGCTPRWVCTLWSNLGSGGAGCGTRTCTDRNYCNKPQTKPIESRTCPGVASFCGDGVCDSNENEITCLADCPKALFCGDGTCSSDESSLTCSEDCKPEKPKNKWWIFWFIAILFLAAIAGVGYAIYRKATKEEKSINANIESKKKEINLPKNIPSNSYMKKPEVKNIKKGNR